MTRRAAIERLLQDMERHEREIDARMKTYEAEHANIMKQQMLVAHDVEELTAHGSRQAILLQQHVADLNKMLAARGGVEASALPAIAVLQGQMRGWWPLQDGCWV